VNSYKYTISLIIIGDFEAQRLKHDLGLDDAVTKNKGDKRGTKVDGEVVYQERSTIRKLFYREIEGDVLPSINEICRVLESKGALYLKVSQEHDVELFIGIFGDDNFGFELDCATLRRMEHLGLSLSFDVYPRDDQIDAAATAPS
jgi:hypothetical protein